MRTNRYAGNCVGCEKRVAARQGLLFKRGGHWAVAHKGCADTSEIEPKVSYSRAYGGDTYTSCGHEDYPCCGC